MSKRHAFVLVLSLALSAVTVEATNTKDVKTPPLPSFPASVELVVVDAAVLDQAGQPVVGLKRSDFIVLEDGQPQEISSFEAFVAPSAPASVRAVVTAPIQERVVTNTAELPQGRRTFVVVFDDVHLTSLQGGVARQAITDFVQKSLREGDHVTLVTTGGSYWWNTTMMSGKADLAALIDRLKGVRPEDAKAKLSDFEAMRILEEDRASTSDLSGLSDPNNPMDPTMEAPGDRPLEVRERVRRRWTSNLMCLADCYREIDMEARRQYMEVEARSRMTLETLDRVMRALTVVPGRKAIILVSAGFVHDRTQDGFRTVKESARRANAAVYFVDVRGLSGLVGDTTAESRMPTSTMDVAARAFDFTLDSAGADDVAHDTGGFSVRNTNDFAQGLGRISDESRAYYLLGYYPKNIKRDGKFRKIEVQVNRRDVKVRARRGYYASDGAEAAAVARDDTMHPEVREALDAPVDQGEIPLRMASYVFDQASEGKARVLLATEIDVSRLGFGDSAVPDATTELQMQFVVALRDASETLRYDDRIAVKAPAAKDREHWWSVVREFEIPPDVCQAKVVARDIKSGKVGSVSLRFEVPPFEGLRLSTPILTDVLETPSGENANPAPVLRAHRGFRAESGARLYCQFDVMGAATSPATGKTDVTAGYILVDKEGRPQRWSKPTALAPSADGRTRRLIGIPIETLKPGDYDLVLVVEDKTAGKTQELREPFSII